MLAVCADVAIALTLCPSPTGANPSAEEADEGVDDQTQTVNDVVFSFRLQPTTFDKKGYLTYLKVSVAPGAPYLP